MIHFRAKMAASGYTWESAADRVRICYTPKQIYIKLLIGDKESVYKLSDRWDDDAIVKFACDKFTIEV